MSASSKVDAIQAAVAKAVKAALVEHDKRNKANAEYEKRSGKVNKPTRGFLEKIIRSRLQPGELVDAFTDDALAAVADQLAPE